MTFFTIEECYNYNTYNALICRALIKISGVLIETKGMILSALINEILKELTELEVLFVETVNFFLILTPLKK